MDSILRQGLLVAALAAVTFPVAFSAPVVEPRRPGESDRCPVCGMLVQPHSEWIAQVILADGSALFFDGSRDLFKYLLSHRDDDQVAAAFVTSYYDLEPIAATDAFFVLGSDVRGPMGAELVPHPSREAAEEFLSDHGGERIVLYEEVTEDLLRALQ